jgi:hypothetical protein
VKRLNEPHLIKGGRRKAPRAKERKVFANHEKILKNVKIIPGPDTAFLSVLIDFKRMLPLLPLNQQPL